MSKICLIRQPAGLGDIFFLQKIAKIYISQGFEVWWPVIGNFVWVKNYIKIPNLHFVNESDEFPLKHLYTNGGSDVLKYGEHVYLPIQHFDRHYPGFSVMYSKYRRLNIEYEDWCDYFQFERNLEREQDLKKILNVPDEPYVFVNRQYGSPPDSKNCNYIGQFDNSVEMKYIDGFSIFDWIGLIEDAKHIHTAETSLLYILKKLNLSNVSVYSKHNPPNYYHVSELFPKNWNFIL